MFTAKLKNVVGLVTEWQAVSVETHQVTSLRLSQNPHGRMERSTGGGGVTYTEWEQSPNQLLDSDRCEKTGNTVTPENISQDELS